MFSIVLICYNAMISIFSEFRSKMISIIPAVFMIDISLILHHAMFSIVPVCHNAMISIFSEFRSEMISIVPTFVIRFPLF